MNKKYLKILIYIFLKSELCSFLHILYIFVGFMLSIFLFFFFDAYVNGVLFISYLNFSLLVELRVLENILKIDKLLEGLTEFRKVVIIMVIAEKYTVT